MLLSEFGGRQKKYKGKLAWAAGAQFIDLFWGAGMVMVIFQWIAFMALPY